MYDYVALRIDVNPCDETITDLLAAFLADAEFETFEPDDKGLTAYVRKDKYDASEIDSILKDFPIPVTFEKRETEIKGEDWNKEWEQNYFQPILIDNRLLIRSSFHEHEKEVPLEIVIDPKMAFGTGHHATTAGMARLMLSTDLKQKSVIDMGTGTGILSILAKKLGAGDTVGIDIDQFAIENAEENGQLNGEKIRWIVGDDNTLNQVEPADIFLANINLNVITENLDKYVAKLKKGGKILLSGFLESDRNAIMEAAQKEGLRFVRESEENKWMVMEFEK